jgi:hypothetical protein
VTFVEGGNGGYELKVLCPTIRNSILKGTSVTFDEIDTSRLEMPEGVFPYRRLLTHHSFLGHRFAQKQGWSTQDLSDVEVKADALMVYALDKEVQERVRYFWRSAS